MDRIAPNIPSILRISHRPKQRQQVPGVQANQRIRLRQGIEGYEVIDP